LKGEISERTERLTKAIKNEYERLNIITKLNIALKTEIIDDALWATFSKGERHRTTT